MSRVFLRVAKVGGSLFDFADLPDVLRCWIDTQPGTNVLVAGGGAVADAVRAADATFQLGEDAAHELAMETMRVSSRLLSKLLPEATFCRSMNELSDTVADRRSQKIVLDPVDLMSGPDSMLPQSWQTTSDSIAAEVATQLNAHELVLFKSVALPANTNRHDAISAGLIDENFAQTASSFPTVRWVNLRDTPVTERPLR